jgi:hypothetical protein
MCSGPRSQRNARRRDYAGVKRDAAKSWRELAAAFSQLKR